jgi:hypothetical protein
VENFRVVFHASGKPAMKRVSDMDDEASPENGTQEKPELALDLNFVPTWARKPPENPYVGREDHGPRGTGERERPGRRDDRRGSSGRREGNDRRGSRPEGGFRPGGGFPRPGGGAHPGGGFRRPEGGTRPESGFHRAGGGFSRPRGAEERRGPRREGSGHSEGGERRPGRDALPRLNVRVAFLPDRERLSLVVRDIQVSRRAFPLIEIASRFLSREDLYLVKLELPPPPEGAGRQTFVQCLECRRVFRSRANAEAHILNDHLDKFFAIEETEVEPPAGAFACVARCRLSGILLGPPNYHGYNEKIQELWASRFAHMSKAEYLGHIETVRDEALVEQWKDSLRKKTVYRLKEPPEGQEAKAMARTEAQDWIRAGKLNPLLRESARCMVPGPQSKRFDDGALRAAVSLAWQKETRFPFTLSLALRPAFRHMHLHLFKVNAKETYVTAVPPTPVDLATAPAIVKEIVAFLEAHPGSTRHQVLEGLRPGANPESHEASELLLHLGNLAANGGVIEFFNGTLVLPRGGTRSEEKDSKPGKTEAFALEEAPKTGPENAVPEYESPQAEPEEELSAAPRTGEAEPAESSPAPVPLGVETSAPISAETEPVKPE